MTKSVCTPEAWDALKADYQRPQNPSLSACIVRARMLAEVRGWTLPSDDVLRRRMRRELNGATA
ncbi:DNA-binding domain-containing protein [Brevundimonas faecalis]|uniref:DNA-binding domain-containing protein n=1 Tax=Brevundimonas faecalis TaxID=947378 RepID=UPI00361C73E6